MKVTAFIALSLSVSTLMTTLSPRPVSAEGPLLGTVRCLVRTILTTECRRAEAPTPTPTPAPAPSNPGTPGSPGSPGGSTGSTGATPTAGPTQTSSRTAQSGQTTSRTAPQNVAPINETVIPGEVATALPEAVPVGEATSSYARMSGPEYLAFFNTYSNYAVAGAEQQAASVAAPIEQSDEGWRIYGIAWYWWGIGVAGAAALATTAYRKRLSRNSITA